jgi:hypothetical protein
VNNGPPSLSGAYAAAATFAMRLHAQVPRYSQRKQANTNGPVARKTGAHKLARACYHRMHAQVPFAVAKAFG